MVKLIWSPKSLYRIDQIANYIEDVEGSLEIAQKFVRSIFKTVERLIFFPKSG